MLALEKRLILPHFGRSVVFDTTGSKSWCQWQSQGSFRRALAGGKSEQGFNQVTLAGINVAASMVLVRPGRLVV